MKRSCFIIRDDFRIVAPAKRAGFTIKDFRAGSQTLAMNSQPAGGWTMMFAVTLAVLVSGMIWYGNIIPQPFDPFSAIGTTFSRLTAQPEPGLHGFLAGP